MSRDLFRVYGRMYRCICSFVLFDDSIIGDVKYFAVLPTENQCYEGIEIF